MYASPAEVEATIAGGLGATIAGAKPMHGYESARVFLDDAGRPVAHLLFGGSNGHPHAWASGRLTEPFADLVRSVWPADHHVTRFDSAVDFLDRDGEWQKAHDIAVGLAERRRLRLSTAGDWVRERSIDDAGRTLYVGSMKSPVFVRLYEKGKHARSTATPDELQHIDPAWCRLEVQVRPQREARRRAATASPADVWGFSSWTGALASEFAGIAAERVVMHEHRDADVERSLSWMLGQYRRVLSALRFDLGSWEAVGDYLGRRLEPPGEHEPF